MLVEFKDLSVECPEAPGRSNPFPLEITLCKDAIFTSQDSVPSIIQPSKKYNTNGIALVGYLRSKTSDYIDITFDRLDQLGQRSELGGKRIYRNAIRKIKVFSLDEQNRD